MKALLLCGSVAQKSHTLALLEYVEELLKQNGFETVLWELKTTPLPVVVPEYHRDPMQHPEKMVKDFVTEVETADVVVLGSPLYHGSYSGVLKNALDNLRGDAFRDKWVGVVGNAGGLRSSHVQFSHLRQVVSTLVGYCAQTQIGTCPQDYAEVGGKYILQDLDMKQRCERLVKELVKQLH